MDVIKEIKIGRLKSKTDFNKGLEYDLTKFPTNVPVIEVEFVANTNKYAIVVAGFTNDFFADRLVTAINHFLLVSFNGEKWTQIEKEYVDAEIFPNLTSLIADFNSFLDLQTGKLYDKSNPFCYENDLTKEIKDEESKSFDPKKYEQKLKSNMKEYYQYLSESQVGIATFNMITEDIYNRLLPFKV
jgi:hypothetical protein